MADAEIDGHGRPHPPSNANEVETLLGFLDYQRATLAWKCRGLDKKGLSETVGVSSITLGGLLTHLAFVEDHWLSFYLHGRDRRPPWNAVDRSVDPDWDWRLAFDMSPDELHFFWEAAVERARTDVADALADGGLDRPARRSRPNGTSQNLRRILVHLIEEYARHNGHADLLRESIDGQTGQ